MFFLIFTNHSWKGEAAIFNINDMITIFCIIAVLCRFFICMEAIIKMPEAMD